MEKTKTKSCMVMTFVGIDAHIGHCTLKALDRQGETVMEAEVPTKSRDLRQALAGLPSPVWVMIESSYLSLHIRDVIKKAVDRLIVCETRENRWIARSESKGDRQDADRLARLLRMGEYKEVWAPEGLSRERRELMRYYQKATAAAVRFKNQIKSKYREYGIEVSGDSVFSAGDRSDWLRRLKSPSSRLIVENWYELLDASETARARLLERLHELLRNTKSYQRLLQVPGVGKVTAPIMLSVIDDPFRFSSKRELWSYAGLGVSRQWSSDPERARVRGSNHGNRALKYAAHIAAQNALRGDNRFSRHYEKMLADNVDPAMAKKTVARQILATALAMLKSGEPYREAQDLA